MAAPTVPSSVFDLVEGGPDFVFDDWANALSRLPLFRVVGVRRVLQSVGIPLSDLHGYSEFKTLTQAMVPAQWRAEFAPTNNASSWTQLGRPQLPRVGKGDFQVFDSACLSVLYIANFLHSWGDRLPRDYFTCVRIVPITYGIGGLSEGFFEREVVGTTFLSKLLPNLHATNQLEVAKTALSPNGRVSRQNAEVVHRMLSNHFQSEQFHIKKAVSKPCARTVLEDLELSVRSDLPRGNAITDENRSN